MKMMNDSEAWLFRCQNCGTWGSTLTGAINSSAVPSVIDESQRAVGLETIRATNLEIVVNTLLQFGIGPNSKVLDVGSAHGWFLDKLAMRGVKGAGIEPDEAIRALRPDLDVRRGYFPEALEPSETFDAICFNDVLEHIPDVASSVQSVVRHLNPGGLLSVNIPNSRGLIFKISRILKYFGLKSPFFRLWQVGLPSPHLWYFDEVGLRAIGASNGLKVVSCTTLATVSRHGLWGRIHFDRRPNPLTALAFAVIWCFAPLMNLRSTSDILHIVFRKP
jgi:SAM-dependent methyltransferase